MPGISSGSSQSTSGKVYYFDSRYVTTIDAIEKRSGFDFFANVPEDLQEAAESQSSQLW
jgi:DNA/RNA endonuclease G (NUC1)